MSAAARILLALPLLVLAAFSGLGILATFEPPGAPQWRLAYAIVGFLSLVGVLALAARRAPARTAARGSRAPRLPQAR